MYAPGSALVTYNKRARIDLISLYTYIYMYTYACTIFTLSASYKTPKPYQTVYVSSSIPILFTYMYVQLYTFKSYVVHDRWKEKREENGNLLKNFGLHFHSSSYAYTPPSSLLPCVPSTLSRSGWSRKWQLDLLTLYLA